MGQIISTVAVGVVGTVAGYAIYRRPLRERQRIHNELPENNGVPIKDPNWVLKQIRGDKTGVFKIELDKLKVLILRNLISTKDVPHGASKAINSNYLDAPNTSFPVPKSRFPNDPIWYGPYDTVQRYIESQRNPGQEGISFDTFLFYPFNKTINCYLVRFTDISNKLNIDLIRQMYHCLELFWTDQGLIDNRTDGLGIDFITFDGERYKMSIRDLRSMYGYYNSRRVSYYRQDRFIITEFMKLIEMMNYTPSEIDGPIAGYYLDDHIFHPEFTILGRLQRDMLKKPLISISTLAKNGTRIWSLKLNGGGVNLEQPSNLLQIEPNLSNKQKLLEMEQPLQIKPTLTSQVTSSDLPFPGITNSDEFIKIIHDFFNYQYEVVLFDISDLKLSNIRNNQLELNQKALLLITDKNLYHFAEKFLYLYTISPVENISSVKNIGGKRNKYKRTKCRRSKGKNKRNKSKNKRNKSKYNL